VSEKNGTRAKEQIKYHRNTNISNYLPSFDNSSLAYLWYTNHLRNFRSDGVSQD